jgi:hypothetical protein
MFQVKPWKKSSATIRAGCTAFRELGENAETKY